MNTKRQTIWLVSMLSLMVVLSAYYLFTEDVNKLNTTTENVMQNDIKVTTDVKDPQGEQVVIGEGVSKGAAESEAGKNDARVLETLKTSGQSGSGFFAEQAIKRNDQLNKLMETLYEVAGNPNNSTEDIAQATNELAKLQDKQAKIESLEDQLGRMEFRNVIIMEEGSKFKAIVQTEKLDAKQAQAIIDLMITELNVSKDLVSVQYRN